MKQPQDTLTGSPCYEDAVLLGFVHDILDATAKEEFEAHLAECKRCRLEIARLRKALQAAEQPPSGEAARLLAASQERVRSRLFGETESDSDVWARAKELLRGFVHEFVPDESVHFDAVWSFMDRKGLLGSFDPAPQTRPLSEVGFVPAIMGEVRLPVVLGVFSNVLAEILEQGLAPKEAVERHRQLVEDVLTNFAGMPTEESRGLYQKFTSLVIKQFSTSNETSDGE